MDHIGYKWWKKQDTDWPQVKLEVIDIWHFGLSDILVRKGGVDEALGFIEAELQNLPVTANVELREAAEAMALSSLATQQFSVADFVVLMNAATLDFDALYTAYVGKNVLNFFRQDNGYKQGSYRKLWDGREDNEHLSELAEALDNSSEQFADELYAALASRYSETEATA